MNNYPTLPEAIRIGAKIRPQNCNGKYFHGEASCTLGAAMEGSGFVNFNNIDSYQSFFNAYPSVKSGSFLWNRILCMNDFKRKTREEIADILEVEGVTY